MNEIITDVDDLRFTAFKTDDKTYLCTVRDTSNLGEAETFKSFNASAAEVQATAYLMVSGKEDFEAAIADYEEIGRLYDAFPGNLRPIP